MVQEWCLTTPAIHSGQLIGGFMCIAIGYAFTATMSTSTMTQVLPAGQQVFYSIHSIQFYSSIFVFKIERERGRAFIKRADHWLASSDRFI